MNKQTIPARPDETKIEELLAKIQPLPGEAFHQKMARAPWRAEARMIKPRTRLQIAVAMMILFAVALLIFTPQGRAWAQQLLGFFSTAQRTAFPATPGSQAVVPTSVAPVESATALAASDPEECGATISATRSTYLCQLRTAEASLGFDIKVFSKESVKQVLRSDLNFTSLAAHPATQSVRVIFLSPSGIHLWLAQGLGDFPPARAPWEVVPQGAVEPAQVGEYPAEYLKGEFVQWVGSQEFTWESNVANTQRLRWKEGDRWFEIRSMGGARELSRPFLQAELIALAEDLVSYSQGTDLIAGTDSPGLDERAGFHIKQPTVLPAGFQLCNADYEAGYDGPTAFLAYCDATGNSIVIDQILVAKASPYDFAERWGEPITITPVQIASVIGSHAVREDGIQVLMWEADGIRTQIVFQWDRFADTGKRIDQAGLLTIAESMQ